jgi:hypothetical protein
MRTLGVWWARVSGASAGEPTVAISHEEAARIAADVRGPGVGLPVPAPGAPARVRAAD